MLFSSFSFSSTDTLTTAESMNAYVVIEYMRTNNNKKENARENRKRFSRMRKENFLLETITSIAQFPPTLTCGVVQIDLIPSLLSQKPYFQMLTISLVQIECKKLNLFVDFAFSILSHV